MATLRFSVLPARQTSKHTYVIYLTLTHKREVRYIATEYEIDDLFQFDKGEVVCRKDAKILNQRLKYLLSEFKERLNSISDIKYYSCSQLKEKLTHGQKKDQLVTIKEYMEYRIDYLRKNNRNSYACMNEYSLKKIVSILGNITLQSITPQTINKFIKGMSNLSNATQQMRLTHLKACINEAIQEGIVKYETHPFLFTKMPKSPAKQLDLTIEEFLKIRDFNTKHKRLLLGKNLLLLSFYLGGMNLVDIVEVDFKGTNIKYVRKKTSNKKQGEKNIVFSIPEEAQKIIKLYIQPNGKLDFGYNFSYVNFQRYLNYCLKLLKKELNIDSEISFYSARKTFSQFAFDLGIRTEIIEYCMGHSMKDNRPIYNYVRVMQKQADLAIRKVIDYTNDPESVELTIVTI